MKGWHKLAIGTALTLLITWAYYGPLGTADQFASRVEAEAHAKLVRDEMTAVSARLQRHPLTRVIILSGPADDFQRGELIRRMSTIPGVSGARWDPASLPVEQVPR
jgi:hypothetical protein